MQWSNSQLFLFSIKNYATNAGRGRGSVCFMKPHVWTYRKRLFSRLDHVTSRSPAGNLLFLHGSPFISLFDRMNKLLIQFYILTMKNMLELRTYENCDFKELLHAFLLDAILHLWYFISSLVFVVSLLLWYVRFLQYSWIFVSHCICQQDVLDPPEDCFRIRMVVTLLETCGHYFGRGSSKRKLDRFLIHFQRYILSKGSLPLDIEFDLQVRNHAIMRFMLSFVGSGKGSVEHLFVALICCF